MESKDLPTESDYDTLDADMAESKAETPVRYSATHLHDVLHRAFHSSATNHLDYYETDKAIIFAPCTDTLPNSDVLKSIAERLKAYPSAPSTAKLWLFPIAEERGLFGIKRNHWVTLCYAPDTKTATVIDSIAERTWPLNYNIKPIFDQLAVGLSDKGMEPFTEQRAIYQGCQEDQYNCGPWTVMNVLALAQGVSVDALKDYYQAKELQDILTHLGEAELTGYTPLTHREWKKEVELKIQTHYEENSYRYVTTAKNSFDAFFIHQETMNNEFMSALPVFQNRLAVNAPTTQEELVTILKGLNSTYASINRSKWLEETSAINSQLAYTYKDPSRTFTSLKLIGLEDKDLNQLPFWKIALLEAAISYALAEYQRVLTSDKVVFCHQYSDHVLPTVEEMLQIHEKKEMLYLLLLNAVHAEIRTPRVLCVLIEAELSRANDPSPLTDSDNSSFVDLLVQDITENTSVVLRLANTSSEGETATSQDGDDLESVALEENETGSHGQAAERRDQDYQQHLVLGSKMAGNHYLSQHAAVSPPSNVPSYTFQLNCLKVLLAISVGLALLTILACPPVAVIGLTGVAATAVMVTAATLSGVGLAGSVYGFYHYHEKAKKTLGALYLNLP